MKREDQFGQDVNRLKSDISGWLESRHGELEQAQIEGQFEAEKIDVTQPGRSQSTGYDYIRFHEPSIGWKIFSIV